MTVYEPGGECLTRVQHEHREFQKKLQEKANPSPAAEARNLSSGKAPDGALTATAIKPVDTPERTVPPKSAQSGQILDFFA